MTTYSGNAVSRAGRSFWLDGQYYSSIREWCSTVYRPVWHKDDGSIEAGHIHSCSKEMARALYRRQEIGVPQFDDEGPPPTAT